MASVSCYKGLVKSVEKWRDKIRKNFNIDVNSFSDRISENTKDKIQILLIENITDPKEKGDLLEDVIRELFETLDFAFSFNITNKETDYGQFDFIVDFLLKKENI